MRESWQAVRNFNKIFRQTDRQTDRQNNSVFFNKFYFGKSIIFLTGVYFCPFLWIKWGDFKGRLSFRKMWDEDLKFYGGA